MKSNLFVKAAVSAAMLASASSAFAATPSADHLLRIGGATATNGVLRDLYLSSAAGLCASDVDVYFSGTQFSGSTQVLITCVAKTFASASYNAINGEAIGYVKESLGGSGNGVGPVANQTNLTFMNVSAPGCSTVTSSVAAASGLLGYTLHTACTATQSLAPEIGIADVEGRLLNYTGTALTARPLLDIVFGVPVSLPLYRALQGAQGLAATDSCSTVPSLTRAQITGIYGGTVFDSSVLVSADDGDTGAQLDGTPKSIHICRRGNTSGTQAGARAYFMGEGCAANVQPFLTPDVGGTLNSGSAWPTATIGGVLQDFRDDIVIAGSGSGQVAACLNFFAGNAGDDFAVGVLSTENSTIGQNYRFVRIDGALPTLEQTANGNYQYFTSNVLNTANNLTYSTDETAMWTYISDAAGSPSLLDPVNQPFRDGICTAVADPDGAGPLEAVIGDGGVLASSKYIDAFGFPAGHTAPFSGLEVRDNPINTMTKQPLGVINNCQAPLTHPAVEAEAAGGQFRATVPTFQ